MSVMERLLSELATAIRLEAALEQWRLLVLD
jgi:hypothetical protein